MHIKSAKVPPDALREVLTLVPSKGKGKGSGKKGDPNKGKGKGNVGKGSKGGGKSGMAKAMQVNYTGIVIIAVHTAIGLPTAHSPRARVVHICWLHHDCIDPPSNMYHPCPWAVCSRQPDGHMPHNYGNSH